MEKRLAALAELLRSEHRNERTSAMRLIERTTGKHLDALIKRGINRSFKPEERKALLGHIRRYAGDVMIRKIGDTLEKCGVHWSKIIEAGNKHSLGEKIRVLRGKRIDDGTKRCEPEGMRRDTMPSSITGVPHVWDKGMDRGGRHYAIIYFLVANDGNRTIRPLLPFVAYGDEWIRTIETAAREQRNIKIELHEPGVRAWHVEAQRG